MYSDTVTHIEMTDEMLFTEMYKLQSIQYKIIIILITIYLYIYYIKNTSAVNVILIVIQS